MRSRMPKSWLALPQSEKKIISEVLEKQVRETVDHEEAELQKRWLQLACIVLHNSKDRFGKTRLLAFLAAWKRIYQRCDQFTTDAEIEAYLKSEMDKIFGKDGYPYEYVDSLEGD